MNNGHVRVGTAAWAIVFVVMLQLLITQWTVKAASNEDVVDYLSFAGDLTGIILAVLAIIYSYLTTVSQRIESEGMRTQLSRLADSTDRVIETKNQISDEVDRLEEIRTRLEEIGSSSAAALETHKRIEGKVDVVLQQKSWVAGNREAAKPSQDEHQQFRAALQRIASMATPWQVLHYFAAMGASADEVDARSTEFVMPSVASEGMKSYIQAQVFAYHLIFQDLGAIVGKSREPELRRMLGEAIPAAIDLIKNKGSNTFKVDVLVKNLESLRDRLKDR